MKKLEIIIPIVLLVVLSCTKPDYFKVYKVSSPDGTKCLTFLGEYDGSGIVKNNRMYILGYDVDTLQKIDKVPDTNYLAMSFYGDMDGIDVKWESEKIELYSSSKPLENKLSTFSRVIFMGSIPDSAVKNSHLYYSGYFFQQVHRNKYRSCP